MAALRLEPLNAANIVAANSLNLKPGQQAFATPVSYAHAEQSVDPSTSWPRVVMDGDQVVGSIMGNLDPNAASEEFRCCVWRLNVRADQQGRGIGRFAVHGLAEEARSRGFDRMTVIWEPGDDGPESFFLRIGFTPVGETQFGETLGALAL
ncbi:GNAT family N-acetyltransferase [uncultured Amnibacterium sp.]|uniref:GNAT family N-acetyltransferase n=1 Tax=uncultured Amnibacterium sp. TaxID=1631851 RepID=UPI0035CB1CDF